MKHSKIVSITGLRHPFIFTVYELLRFKSLSNSEVFPIPEAELRTIEKWNESGGVMPSYLSEHLTSKGMANAFIKQLLEKEDPQLWNLKEYAKPQLVSGKNVVVFNGGDWWIDGELHTLEDSIHPLHTKVKKKLSNLMLCGDFDLIVYLRLPLDDLIHILEIARNTSLGDDERRYLTGIFQKFEQHSVSLGDKVVSIDVGCNESPILVVKKVYETLLSKGIT